MPSFNLLYTLLTIVGALAVIMTTCAYLVMLERKISAWVQDRIGPNRVGPWGLLQPLADGLKFLLKEDPIPGRADKVLFLLAPCLAVATALLAFAVVPFGAPTNLRDTEDYQFAIAPGIDIGILFVFAVSSLAVYGIILGGWASNNKYSFLGSLRSSAQVISYEIPLGVAILPVLMLSGTLRLDRIIEQQASGTHVWYVFFQPLAFLIFMVSSFAECNRLPFDLAEAEQELIGGYHTEYGALKLGLFFIGEYTHMITTSFLMVILFFGGWHFWLIAEADAFWLVKLIVFTIKMALFIVFYMLIRWTIPRFRFDQLMAMAWKVLIPLALVNLVGVMVVLECGWTPWLLLPFSVAVLVGAAWFGTLPQGPAVRVPLGNNEPVAAGR
jgi:NADH-quinone oxidoreductase subunit H